MGLKRGKSLYEQKKRKIFCVRGLLSRRSIALALSILAISSPGLASNAAGGGNVNKEAHDSNSKHVRFTPDSAGVSLYWDYRNNEANHTKVCAYLISDIVQFDYFCCIQEIGDEEKAAIFGASRQEFDLDDRGDEDSAISKLNVNFYNLLKDAFKDRTPHNVVDINYYNNFMKDTTTPLEKREIRNSDIRREMLFDSLRVPGLGVSIDKGATYLAYYISNLDDFRVSYEELFRRYNNISKLTKANRRRMNGEIKKIIAAQNCYIYIKGHQRWNISMLPEPFFNQLNAMQDGFGELSQCSVSCPFSIISKRIPFYQWAGIPSMRCKDLKGFDILPNYEGVKDMTSREFISSLGWFASLKTLWNRCGL